MKTETTKLADALFVLAREIKSGDGVANAAIAEAAQRLSEQHVEIEQWRNAYYRQIAKEPDDAARLFAEVRSRGHRYVLIVSPRDGGSRMRLTHGLSEIEVARLLEAEARDARESARFSGDE